MNTASNSHSPGSRSMGSQTAITNAAALTHPRLREIFDFWAERCGGRAMPLRQDIDPIDMRPWLPHLLLADILGDEHDLRFRVIGTWIANRVGRDDSGKTMREIGLNGPRQHILDSYLKVAESGLPHRSAGAFYDRSQVRDYLQAERLLLPVSRTGSGCDIVLSGIYFLDD